jgi:hypothetical protein
MVEESGRAAALCISILFSSITKITETASNVVQMGWEREGNCDERGMESGK